MSTSGVISRMTAIVNTAIAEDRPVSAEEFKGVYNYANNGWGSWGFSKGEKRALLQPGKYLQDAGVDLGKVVFAPEALNFAVGLATKYNVELFPLIRTTGSSAPTPAAPDHTTLQETFAKAMAQSKPLGSYEGWTVRTAGADVSFKTTGGNKTWPALVLDKVQFSDPAARDLVAENSEALADIKTNKDLKVAIGEILKTEKAYFAADGVDVKYPNEQYGIASLRREAFISGLRSLVDGPSSLPGEDKAAARGVIEGANIELATGHDFQMKIGSHTNYWPYWRNYLPPLEKMATQTEEGSAPHHQLLNRIRDIHRRKTAHSRSINERDFETSIGMALVYSPAFSDGVGKRVSVTEDSTPFKPKYELLSIGSEGLPEGFETYAGMQVVRGDEGKLIVDYMGEGESEVAKLAKTMVGKEIPAEIHDTIQAKQLNSSQLSDLTMREFVEGEVARTKISMDWDSNGQINVAQVFIGWWGHCHNEAPLNALDIDPQKGVSFYRADRGVDAEKALAEYSTEDAWHIAGAFVSDHESGYSVIRNNTATRVDNTDFVGIRNDGKHTFTIELSGSTVSIDAGIQMLEREGEVVNPGAAFRTNREVEGGTFEANPYYISTSAREDDLITIDVNDAKMSLKAKYITFDADGYRTEKEEYFGVDPTVDKFEKLAEEIVSQNPSGRGGEIIEHYYNAQTKEYHSIKKEVTEENEFTPTQVGDPTPNVVVENLTHTSESEYDSSKEIFDFYMKNPGLPKTYDTESGKAVWNYPVNRESVDLVSEVEKEESGQTYTYRTFNLKYTTMGGPGGESSFILKYNTTGNVVDSMAIDPMPDFVFRNDHWVSAPVTTDIYGQSAYNLKALEKGYLLRQGGRTLSDIETALWEMEATVLYAALTDETAADQAYIFETDAGEIVSFADKATFDAAVEADKALRASEN